MTNWAKALSPFDKANTEEEAVAQARASSVALVLASIATVASYFMMQDYYPIMAEAMGNADMAGAMAQQGMIMTGVVIVIQLGLAVLQWFKPNKIIPWIFMLLCLLGVVSIAMILMPSPLPPPPTAATFGTWAVNVVCVLLHIAGIRGASALPRLRGEE